MIKYFFRSSEHFTAMLFTLFYIAGILFHLLPDYSQWVVQLTNNALWTSNIIVLIFAIVNSQKKFVTLVWVIFSIIATLILEIVGVQTGMIFGDYKYGDTLNQKIYDVPLIIGLNWVVLILATHSISRLWFKNQLTIAAVSSVLIVVFDYLLEPVAIHLDYWEWKYDNIPIQNYLAWMLISFLFSISLSALKICPNSILLKVYFVLQLLFFLSLNLFLK